MSDDLFELWTACHDYLVAQANEDPTALSTAYARLVDVHNRIHAEYIAATETPPQVAGT
jgi:hypothetical protein